MVQQAKTAAESGEITLTGRINGRIGEEVITIDVESEGAH
jgi:hypothetical protein